MAGIPLCGRQYGQQAGFGEQHRELVFNESFCSHARSALEHRIWKIAR